MDTLENNKARVRRFNNEVIEECNAMTFGAIKDKEFINRTAPRTSNGTAGMWHTFNNIFKPACGDLKVGIHDQLAEGDKVTTRKAIVATHTGELMGIPATHKKIRIDVIDIVRLRHGKYFEHWGINTLQIVVADPRRS